jgi:hypothetical protein
MENAHRTGNAGVSYATIGELKATVFLALQSRSTTVDSNLSAFESNQCGSLNLYPYVLMCWQKCGRQEQCTNHDKNLLGHNWSRIIEELTGWRG